MLVDKVITAIMLGTPGEYVKLPFLVKDYEWVNTIFPYIEQRVSKDKLLINTLIYFAPYVGTIFLKNVDTPKYRKELSLYYLALKDKSVVIHKSLHKIDEVIRNLYIVYDIHVEKVIECIGNHHVYTLLLNKY